MTERFPLLAEAIGCDCGPASLMKKRWQSDRMAFHRLIGCPTGERDASVILFAFDLVELNGHVLRRTPIERKAALAKLLSRAAPRIQLNEHIEEVGGLVFEHACRLGFEGIVSKRPLPGCASSALVIGL